MPRTSSLFDFLLQREYAQADMARQKAEQEQLKQEQTAKEDRDFWSNQLSGDFDRRLKLVELQAKMAGAMGQPAPDPGGFDLRLQDAVGPNYMAGQFEGGKLRQEAELKRLMEQGRMDRFNSGDETRRYIESLRNEDRDAILGLRRDVEMWRNEDRDAERARKDAEFSKNYNLQLQEFEDKKLNNAGRLWLDHKKHNDLLPIHELQARNSGIRLQTGLDDRIEEKVTKLKTDTEDLAGMRTDLNTLLKATQSKDVAGVGLLAGMAPDRLVQWVSGPEGVEVRNASSRLLIQLLREQSGATVSDRETLRTQVAYKLDPSVDNAVFIQGVTELAEIANRAMQNKVAGHHPEAVRRFTSRGGVLNLPTRGQASQQSPAPSQQHPVDPVVNDIITDMEQYFQK